MADHGYLSATALSNARDHISQLLYERISVRVRSLYLTFCPIVEIRSLHNNFPLKADAGKLSGFAQGAQRGG